MLKAYIFLLIFAISSHASALTFKSGESLNKSTNNRAWVSSIRTELHDLDINTASFDFIDERLEQSLSLFPNNEFTMWGTSEKRDVDCKLVLKEMRPVGDFNDWEGPLYIQNCSYYNRQNLFNGGIEFFQDVLNHWAKRGAASYSIDQRLSYDGYSKRVAVASLTTTYALFYNHFTNHDDINQFLSDWLLVNQTPIKKGKKRCPVEFPPNYRKWRDAYETDSCGSNNWRTAIANIAFGLRTKNQDVYIAGVKQFEINISMYDSKGIFVPYASRGWDGPGYAIDNDEYISALAILFNDIGFDLYDLKVKDGQRVSELIAGHVKWLEDPSIAEKYILGTKTCNEGTCEIFTDFSQAGSLKKWKLDKQFETHDIQLRQLYYLLKRKNLTPNDIEAVALSYPYSNKLPHMYIWGQTSSFPHIFITLNEAGRLESYIKKALGPNFLPGDGVKQSLRSQWPEQVKLDEIVIYFSTRMNYETNFVDLKWEIVDWSLSDSEQVLKSKKNATIGPSTTNTSNLIFKKINAETFAISGILEISGDKVEIDVSGPMSNGEQIIEYAMKDKLRVKWFAK